MIIRNHRFGASPWNFLRKNKKLQKFSPCFLFWRFIVENCLRAIENYNLETATRTGKPNAFAYFTQISWYAFLRRIAKEKKQQDIKFKYLSQSGLEDFVDIGDDNAAAVTQAGQFIDTLKDRIGKVKAQDHAIKEYSQTQKKRKRKSRTVDSDLQDFFAE